MGARVAEHAEGAAVVGGHVVDVELVTDAHLQRVVTLRVLDRIRTLEIHCTVLVQAVWNVFHRLATKLQVTSYASIQTVFAWNRREPAWYFMWIKKENARVDFVLKTHTCMQRLVYSGCTCSYMPSVMWRHSALLTSDADLAVWRINVKAKLETITQVGVIAIEAIVSVTAVQLRRAFVAADTCKEACRQQCMVRTHYSRWIFTVNCWILATARCQSLHVYM